MLRGTADILSLAAPVVPEFIREPIRFEEAACFQLTAEMRNAARESQLPSGLHPTIPAALSIQVFEVGRSPWGPFRMAVLRISCRSGVRARGFSRTAFATTEAACVGLATQLGYPVRSGIVGFRHGYDGVSVQVSENGVPILRIEAIDPVPMSLTDVQYTGTMNLAQTPKGLRLMQVEMHAETSRVERLNARLETFEGAAWGDVRLRPARVIAASVVELDAEFPPVRFVCKPDELAFTGTESVA